MQCELQETYFHAFYPRTSLLLRRIILNDIILFYAALLFYVFVFIF